MSQFQDETKLKRRQLLYPVFHCVTHVAICNVLSRDQGYFNLYCSVLIVSEMRS